MRTDAEIIAAWLQDRPKSTIESYQIDVQQFLQVIKKPMKEITIEDIQNFATHLLNRNLKDASRKRKLNSIKSLFTFAVRHQHIPFNVAAAIRLPKAESNLAARTLRKEQVIKLIEGGDTERDRLFLLLMYATGMRISETISVKWCDFTEQGSGKMQLSIVGKGSKLRTVIIPDSCWEKLQELRDGRDLLFPFSRQQAHRIVKKAVANAGLDPKISAHFLRHSHCRIALDGGVKIQVLRTSMGHSSLQITDRYCSSFPEESSSDYLGL